MSSFIRDATKIIDDILPAQFSHGQPQPSAGANPESIIEVYKLKLYAQSLSGSNKKLQMLSPTLRRALKDLAQLGSGHSTIVDGVKWKFIPRKFSRLPISAERNIADHFDRQRRQRHHHSNFQFELKG